MFKSYYKTTNENNQDAMPPSEARNPIVLFPEKSIQPQQRQGLQNSNMNVFKGLKEDMNECLDKDHENTTS